MSMQNIIIGATKVQKLIPDIKAIYEDAPNALHELPCLVTYPGIGNIDWPRSPSVRRIEHDLTMDLYIQKGGDLPAADRICKPFIDRMIETFDQHLNLFGSCLNSGIIKYNYGVLEFAGVDYLGIKFTLRAIEITQVVYHG